MSGRAAFFDLDGTVVASDIVRYGVEIRTADRTRLGRALWILAFLPRIPWYLLLDAISRARFQRAFYRIYRGMTPDELEIRARALAEEYVAPRIRPDAAARIDRHAARGDRVVLVTGSIRPIAVPVAESLGVREVLAPDLEVAEGRYTGRLAGEPLAGERKAQAVAGYAADRGLDLADSWAYGDSLDDAPLLAAVGRPAAVNPGRRLLDLAAARGWEVLEWPLPPGD